MNIRMASSLYSPKIEIR